MRRQSDTTSRRLIDVAVGILIGLRGCSQDEAFAELVDAVQRTGVGIGALAEALVALAGGSENPPAHHDAALDVWGELLVSRALASRPTPALG